MPSSPIGPCSSGSTTVRSPAAPSAPRATDGAIDVPVGSSFDGSAPGPAASARLGALGQRPLAVGRDADRRDAVARRVDGRQHVGGGDAADVVLGRLPAEQHDEVDLVGHGPNGTVRRHEDPGIPGGRGDGGTLVGADVESDGASFDTRSLRPGQLFVPLVAERDGHDFVAAAIAAGAAATLWSRPPDTVPALPADRRAPTPRRR